MHDYYKTAWIIFIHPLTYELRSLHFFISTFSFSNISICFCKHNFWGCFIYIYHTDISLCSCVIEIFSSSHIFLALSDTSLTSNYILCAQGQIYILHDVLKSVSSLKNYMNFFLSFGRMMFLHLMDTSRVIVIENVFYMYTAK